MTDADRIAQLEEEVAYLREELGLSQAATKITAFRGALGLTPYEARMTIALHAAYPRVMSKAALFDAMEGSRSEVCIKIVDVYICKLRQKLGAGSITTAWGVGYALSEAGDQHIALALRGAGMPERVAA